MNSRKQKVLKASLQLFNEKGFHNTSIQDILQHANISKGTFYNYFSSKYECFLAILESNRYETSVRRYELLEGQDKQDLTILAQQIAVLFQINQEQNLMAIFHGISQTGDQELKLYLSRHRLYEVQWLMSRLIDVYGEEARPYTYEAAILFYGMIQHLSLSHKMIHKASIDPLILSQTGLRHLNAILPQMIENNEVLLTAEAVPLLEGQLEVQNVDIDELSIRLKEFIVRLEAEPNEVGEQFANVILEEIQHQPPRIAVIETLLTRFRKEFDHTSHALESKQIAHALWTYIMQIKNEQSNK